MGHTMTGVYYSIRLKRLREAIKEKGPEMFIRGGLFRHDSIPDHNIVVAMETIDDYEYTLVP